MKEWRLVDVLDALPEASLPLVESLIERAQKLGLPLYLVGGPVRDLLLRRPLLDIDLMVASGDGAQTLCEAVAKRGVECRTHGRFGTATLSSGDASVDVATCRREVYPRSGALPKVEAGSLEEDLARRDFSVNALALPLTGVGAAETLEVIDRHDGLRDLEQRQLRVLHPKSFHDDPTRALRAARFAPRLDFRLSRGSRSYLRDALRDGAFGAVSGDRLRREFEKAFEDARRGVNPAAFLARLGDWHVLPALEPGLSLPKESIAPLRSLGKLLANPVWRSHEFRPWVPGLCLWLAPLPIAMRRRCLRRLSVRGDVVQRIVEFPRSRDRWLKQLEKSRGRGAMDAVLKEIEEERLQALAASTPAPLRRRIARWAAEDRDRRMPVTGRDLVAIGLEGPLVGKALARIRSGYLDAEVANREEALALARELLRRTRPPKKAPRKRSSRAGNSDA